MQALNKKIYQALALEDPGLVGCQRRAEWLSEEDVPWRWIRGNALLNLFGERKTIYTFAGPMEVYMYHNWLTLYRGGPWNTHWVEDFYDTWSLAVEDENLSEPLSGTIIVFHEDKGNLDLKILPAPEDPTVRVARMQHDSALTPRGRISKATNYAVKTCRWCPVKTRCDAHDKLRGEDGDHAPSYPTP